MLFSTTGILWNDNLSSFIELKKIALTISNLFENYLNFHIPIPNKEISLETNINKESWFFTYLGIF